MNCYKFSWCCGKKMLDLLLNNGLTDGTIPETWTKTSSQRSGDWLAVNKPIHLSRVGLADWTEARKVPFSDGSATLYQPNFRYTMREGPTLCYPAGTKWRQKTSLAVTPMISNSRKSHARIQRWNFNRRKSAFLGTQVRRNPSSVTSL